MCLVPKAVDVTIAVEPEAEMEMTKKQIFKWMVTNGDDWPQENKIVEGRGAYYCWAKHIQTL